MGSHKATWVEFVFDIVLVVLLVLVLKSIFDAHSLAQRNADLTRQVQGLLLREQDQAAATARTQVSDCYTEAAARTELGAVLAETRSGLPPRTAQAIRDAILLHAMSIPTLSECHKLAVTLGLSRP